MKTQANVSVKKEALNDANVDSSNVILAEKAMLHFTNYVTLGKNAVVLNQVAKAFISQKPNATTNLLAKDNTLKGLQLKVFQAHTAVEAKKLVSNNNMHDYLTVVKKIISKKVELKDTEKETIKKIVASCQVLRQGIVSKYAHGEIGFNEVIRAFGLESENATENATENSTENATENATPNPEQEQASSVNLESLHEMIKCLNLEEAAIIQDLLNQHIASLTVSTQAVAS